VSKRGRGRRVKISSHNGGGRGSRGAVYGQLTDDIDRQIEIAKTLPTASKEIDTPAELVEKGWPPRMVLGQPTGISPDSEVELTVAFFGDRAFKIDDIGRVPPYVSESHRTLRAKDRRQAPKSPALSLTRASG
jgi:hypothetical protein